VTSSHVTIRHTRGNFLKNAAARGSVYFTSRILKVRSSQGKKNAAASGSVFNSGVSSSLLLLFEITRPQRGVSLNGEREATISTLYYNSTNFFYKKNARCYRNN
jgi:hypothetical protein